MTKVHTGPKTSVAQSELPARGLPIFTVLMLFAIVGIHFYVSGLGQKQVASLYFEYALIPGRFTEINDYSIPALLTFLTHALLHANWAHVLANAYALFLFGLLAERFLGTVRVTLVYLASAIGGGLLFIALDQDGFTPLVGASGAISGLFGAAILAAPERSRKALINNAVLWLAANVAMPALLNSQPGGGRIAWEAHLGGFLVGLLLGWMLRSAMPRVTVAVGNAGKGASSMPQASTAGTGRAPTTSPASTAGAKKPEPFNPVQRRR